MNFNDRLITALDRAQKTQSDLAIHLGITPQAVQQWCNPNGTTPRNKRIKAIASYLNVSQAWLITEEAQSVSEPAGIYNEEVKEKISQLTTQQKQTLSNTSIDQMRAQLQSLDPEQQAIIQAMLESWAQPQRKD